MSLGTFGVIQLAILAFFPSTGRAQDDPECTWCYQCPAPLADFMWTKDNWPGGDYILYIEMNCRFGEEGDCNETPIQCEISEEQEAAQQAELLALIQAADAPGLKALAARAGGRVVTVPERGLLLYLAGCLNDVLAVYPLDRGLLSQIE